MAKSKKDPVRENQNLRRGDCRCVWTRRAGYGLVLLSRQQNLLSVPRQMHRFHNRVTTSKGRNRRSRRMASEDICAADMLVLVRRQRRNIAVPLSQLTAIDADAGNHRSHQRLALLAGTGLLFLTPSRPGVAYAALPKGHNAWQPSPCNVHHAATFFKEQPH